MLRISVLFVPRLVCDIIHCEHHGSTLCSARPGQGKLDKWNTFWWMDNSRHLEDFKKLAQLDQLSFLRHPESGEQPSPASRVPAAIGGARAGWRKLQWGAIFSIFATINDLSWFIITITYPSNAMQFTSCLDLRQCNDGTIICIWILLSILLIFLQFAILKPGV